MARSTSTRKAVERSVDSLQLIYAFVVALAVGRAIEATFIQSGELILAPERLPVFIAFMVTVVPFFHGMNRHLDRCYIERHDEHVQRVLLFDFIVFFIESGLLFALAASARSGLDGFLILVVLLLIDMVWGLLSNWIHYKGVEGGVLAWAAVNAVTIVVILLIYFLDGYAFTVKPWILALVAVVRTVVDYKVSWTFYFPPVKVTT